MITRGERSGVLKALLVRITPFRMSKGMMALCPLLSFHGSNILNAAIHNMPPLAFGIHYEQYEGDMVII